MCKEVKILSKKILSLVDTGSQVTLMKESVWNQLGSPSLINSGNILTGFGLSKTHVIGSFNSTVSIDNQDFPVKINVVPNHSMNFDIIIGCNLIKQANLTITPDSVMFSKLQNEVSDASPQPFVFAITDDIPKFDIGPEIPKQTRNDVEALLVCYRPNKIKTTDIELSITVTDDKPIYHSPRRLPFTERDIVDKQIDEWIQNGVIEPCSSAYASQVLVVRKKTAVHEKIEFLGHIIENNKLFPSPSKTKSVVNYPEPKTTKEVQRFLGLTGYFRKFIPAYSVIAKPLSDLLRKDTPFNFDVKQKASFDELKRLLCQKPVLGIYRQNCETEIHTDASIDGLAAVLLQRFPDDNSLHPIYYMSRKTSETERKYTSYELEVLAIIEALKKFKVYILGMPFKTITDCDAFTKTMSLPRANGQVERINRTIIPVLSKMSEDDPTKWFKHVPSLQEVLNSTFQRSINTTPFELLFGTQINNKTDLRIQQLIDEQLQLEFNENRELLRKAAKTQILKVQNENKKSYNLRRKSPYLYSVKDLVAIKNAARTWTKTLQ
ncbi:retrovirus-related Pol polyprotein from transposon 297 [Trichonephila clavipes]|uniref:Retrovirus-related Pol polyprotein from transposon 297 n=1 Tax=Trichonephila clavipes TaxID=2585209 RepID=A0A8X6VH56_TRICX|nr:retrovirus-related Pol polyprotein from transposon 297 [Trichonephila clavipes]